MEGGSEQGAQQAVLSGPALSEAERRTAAEADAEALVARLVRRLRHHGDRVLQVVGGQECTARWVLERAAAELSCLQSSAPALGPGSTVAVFCGRTPHFAPALVATLCSGAVCAVINPAQPTEVLRRILEDVAPTAVLCDPECAAAVSQAIPAGCPLQVLGRAQVVVGVADDLQTAADRQPGGRHVAAVLTSGTTGRPKVVRIKSRNIILCLELLRRDDAPFGSSDVLLFTTGFFWISGLIFVFWSIDAGLKIVMTSEFSPQTVTETLEKFKPTAVFMPPNQWVSLSRHTPELQLRSAMASVRLCFTGGAKLGAETHMSIERSTGRPLWQWYGQSEAFPLGNILSTGRPSPPPGSVGKLFLGLQAKVVDLRTGQCLGPGVDGELWFRGPFVLDEWVDEQGWIHTGDIGHYDDEENFFIVDRIKELIKYRGFHVSPSELEAALLEHPAVLEAVVVGLPHDEDQEHPAAFVVLAEGAEVGPGDLQRWLADKTHGAQEKFLHGGVFPVSRIPRLPTGKVSRAEVRKVLLGQLTQGQ